MFFLFLNQNGFKQIIPKDEIKLSNLTDDDIIPFVHETSIIDNNVKIGRGTKIWSNSHISSGVRIGENCVIGEGVHIGPNVIIGNSCKIQNHSLIYEGVTIEDYVFLGPNTITTNDIFPQINKDWSISKTFFKKGCSVGANSTIICGVTLNEGCLIGAGSVVTRNIAKNMVAYGNPAKEIYNKIKNEK